MLVAGWPAALCVALGAGTCFDSRGRARRMYPIFFCIPSTSSRDNIGTHDKIVKQYKSFLFNMLT